MQVARVGSQCIKSNQQGWTSRVVPVSAQGPAGFKWVREIRLEALDSTIRHSYGEKGQGAGQQRGAVVLGASWFTSCEA